MKETELGYFFGVALIINIKLKIITWEALVLLDFCVWNSRRNDLSK